MPVCVHVFGVCVHECVCMHAFEYHLARIERVRRGLRIRLTLQE